MDDSFRVPPAAEKNLFGMQSRLRRRNSFFSGAQSLALAGVIHVEDPLLVAGHQMLQPVLVRVGAEMEHTQVDAKLQLMEREMMRNPGAVFPGFAEVVKMFQHCSVVALETLCQAARGKPGVLFNQCLQSVDVDRSGSTEAWHVFESRVAVSEAMELAVDRRRRDGVLAHRLVDVSRRLSHRRAKTELVKDQHSESLTGDVNFVCRRRHY